MICNKILGKVTEFGEKRTKTRGVGNIMVGGTLCPPPRLYRVNPWFTNDLKKMCKKRNMLYRKYIKNPTNYRKLVQYILNAEIKFLVQFVITSNSIIKIICLKYVIV